MKTYQQILFGGEIDTDEMEYFKDWSRSPYLSFKHRYKYRKARLGLYDPKCCGTCDALCLSGTRYFKCKLMGCSNSVASDIQKSCVCDAWRFGRKHAIDESVQHITYPRKRNRKVVVFE